MYTHNVTENALLAINYLNVMFLRPGKQHLVLHSPFSIGNMLSFTSLLHINFVRLC